MASIKGYQIKGHKTFEGREDLGEQGSIYRYGKKVGWYNNAGNGGMADIDMYLPGDTDRSAREERERELDTALKDYFREHPLKGEYAGFPENAETFFMELLNLTDDEKQYKKMAKQGYSVLVIYADSKNWTRELLCGTRTEEAAEKFIKEQGLTEYRKYTSITDFDIR